MDCALILAFSSFAHAEIDLNYDLTVKLSDHACGVVEAIGNDPIQVLALSPLSRTATLQAPPCPGENKMYKPLIL
jgi:hypothetical protein